MQVKELIRLLEAEDPQKMVIGYMEDDNGLRVFEIEAVSSITGKWDRDDDGTPTVRLTSEPGSSTRVCIEIVSAGGGGLR